MATKFSEKFQKNLNNDFYKKKRKQKYFKKKIRNYEKTFFKL